MRLPAFLLLARHAAGRALLGRRGLVLLFLALLPAVLAWLQVRYDPAPGLPNVVVTMLLLVFQFVLPFAGLFLGVSVMGDEIEGRTVTYLFTRPLPRPAVFLARYMGVAAAMGLLVFATVALMGSVFSFGVTLSVREAAAGAGIATLGFLVYAALFAALRVFVERALFVGFILGFIFEGVVSKIPESGVSRISIWHHLALLETRLFAERGLFLGEMQEMLQGIAPSETPATSLVTLAVVLVASLVAGASALRSREVRLSHANT